MDTCFIIGCHPGLLWFIWSNAARQTIENLIQGLGTERKCGIESPTKYGGVLRGRKQNTKYSVTQYVNHEHKLQLKWGMYEWILHDGAINSCSSGAENSRITIWAAKWLRKDKMLLPVMAYHSSVQKKTNCRLQ